MQQFLSKNIENDRLELLVDGTIFPTTTILRAAYMFLDRAYFFFKTDWENIILQILPKNTTTWTAEAMAGEYMDELLAVRLRENLEVNNKTIRETIITRALSSFSDSQNFVSISSSRWNENDEIDRLLNEIENDPELRINEDEIAKILAEIEAESHIRPQPRINFNKLQDVKKNFQSR